MQNNPQILTINKTDLGGYTTRLYYSNLKRSEYQHDHCHLSQWFKYLSLQQYSRGPASLDLCIVEA